MRTEDNNNAALSSRASTSFFLSDTARAELLGWILKALGSKRFTSKINGGHAAAVVEHAWIFQFIDIIYVATIFKLSHLIGECGRGVDVYVLCTAYFAIMFSTRSAFDVYTGISGASGVLHLIACCFYGIGVFIMTVNISAKASSEEAQHAAAFTLFGSEDSSSTSLVSNGGNVSFGSCTRTIDYDVGFAVAFIFTRLVLVVMYGLYFYVFHESNILGHTPEMGEAGKDMRWSDLTRESDLEAAVRAGPPANTSHNSTPRAGIAVSVDENSRSSELTTNTSEIANPMNRFTTVQRPSLVMKATFAFRESVVHKHFTRIFLLKVLPVIFSSIAITALFFGASPVYVLPVVASIEFIGDFLPSYFVHNASDWQELNPHRHFSEERLGLFFMIVLGEAVLGLCATSYTSTSVSKIYRVLLFSFFTIFTMGMQYFEPLQSYTKPEGPHPLDIQKLSPIYMWLVCLASFFMLIAANGMVQLYGDVAYPLQSSLDSTRDIHYAKQKVANGLGSATLIIIAIKILDKVYYRERLLSTQVYNWLDGFYKQAEEQRMASALQRDTLGGGEERPPDMRTSVASAASQGFNDRASFRVVAKEELAVGIRKIKPITRVKVLAALGMYFLWKLEIATEDYMMYNAGLVVLPSLLEVCLEVRNFILHQREARLASSRRAESRSGLELGEMA